MARLSVTIIYAYFIQLFASEPSEFVFSGYFHTENFTPFEKCQGPQGDIGYSFSPLIFNLVHKYTIYWNHYLVCEQLQLVLLWVLSNPLSA